MLHLFALPVSLKHFVDNALAYMSLATIITAVSFHYWSGRLHKRLQRDWSERRAERILNTRLSMLTVWLILVWALLITGVVKWLR